MPLKFQIYFILADGVGNTLEGLRFLMLVRKSLLVVLKITNYKLLSVCAQLYISTSGSIIGHFYSY